MKEWERMQQLWNNASDEQSGLRLVGGYADQEENRQPMQAKLLGLNPNDKFLDLGCGCLRGTIKLIDYLQSGNFYCADISQNLLNLISERLVKFNIKNKPNILKINDFEDILKFNMKFDFVWAISLATHLHKPYLISMLNSVNNVLSNNGIFYFSILPHTEIEFELGDIGKITHNINTLINFCNKQNLAVSSVDLGKQFITADHENKMTDFTNIPDFGQYMMKMKRNNKNDF